MLEIFTLFGASFTTVMLLMLICWFIFLFQRKANIVDVAWGIGFILAAVMYMILGVGGDFFKIIVMTSMVSIWGIRLSYHLLQRYRSQAEGDPRYEFVFERWNKQPNSLMYLMLFIFQGVMIVILSLPFFLVSRGSHSTWTQIEIWGIVVWLVGVAGETLADKQLADFKKEPLNHSAVYQKGLWRFSRHPNYFFEAFVWIGYAMFAWPSNGGWLAISAPVLMLFMIFRVSGIPLTEAQALRSKGELYREYQRTTSTFFPWFPSN